MIRCLGSLYLSWIPLVTLLQSISMSLLACYPLQRRTVFVRMCLHGLLVCSSVFFLITFLFFIQCQGNLAQKERQKQGSYRQWNINKVHENVFLCKKKKRSVKYSQKVRKCPSWRQDCSMIPYTQRQQWTYRRLGKGQEMPRETQRQEIFSVHCTFPQKCNSYRTRH